MVKKCEQCNTPAVDAQSLFCNLCGGSITDEPETPLPVCRTCGNAAPDEQSVFCTRCGLKFAQEPEDRYPVCTSCGSVIPDEHAIFCNRCGAKISGPEPAEPPCTERDFPGGNDKSSRPSTRDRKTVPGSIIITRKKHDPATPAGTPGPGASQPDPSGDSPQAPAEIHAQKKYAHLPLVADENSRDTRSSKKYAHLPLVAEELNMKDSPQRGFYSTDIHEPSPVHKRKHAPGKGILDMFKDKSR